MANNLNRKKVFLKRRLKKMQAVSFFVSEFQPMRMVLSNEGGNLCKS